MQVKCNNCDNSFEFVNPNDGKLLRPIYRNRDGINTERSSIGVVIPSNITISAVGGANSGNLTIPDNLVLGQQPNAAIKAHVMIRDFFANIRSDGTVTDVSGFVYYKDVLDRFHAVASFNGLQTINNMALHLIANAAITDAYPANLGNFRIELVTLTFGTGTFIRMDIRTNLDILYESA